MVCALSGRPFFCHHGLDWRRPLAIRKGQVFDIHGNVERVKVCAGWQTEVRKHITPATKDRSIRRGLGDYCMELIDTWGAETGPAEKKELWTELRRVFLMLVKRSGLRIRRTKVKA